MDDAFAALCPDGSDSVVDFCDTFCVLTMTTTNDDTVACNLALGASTVDPYIHVVWDSGTSTIQAFGEDWSGTPRCCIFSPSGLADPWYVEVTGTNRSDDIDFNYNAWYLSSPDSVITVQATAQGNDQADEIRAGTSNVGPITWALYGGAGADTLYGGPLADTLYGEGAADDLFGYGGNDILYGGSGDDELSGGDGNDLLYGEGDDDVLTCDAGDDQAWGGTGDDFLYGADGNDKLHGNDGSDLIYGGNDDDWICAGASVTSPAQASYGEAGDDWIWGVRNNGATTGSGTSLDCGGQSLDQWGPTTGWFGTTSYCPAASLTWSSISSFCAE